MVRSNASPMLDPTKVSSLFVPPPPIPGLDAAAAAPGAGSIAVAAITPLVNVRMGQPPRYNGLWCFDLVVDAVSQDDDSG